MIVLSYSRVPQVIYLRVLNLLKIFCGTSIAMIMPSTIASAAFIAENPVWNESRNWLETR